MDQSCQRIEAVTSSEFDFFPLINFKLTEMIVFIFEVMQGVFAALLLNTIVGYLDLKYKAHIFSNRQAQPLVLSDKKRYKASLDEKEKQKQELNIKDAVSKENVAATPNSERRANAKDPGIQAGTKSKDTSELVIMNENSKTA